MALEPYLSEIKIFSFNFPPKGWAFCNGQLLPINQNQALFSLLGTTYGGNGQTTFGLPNLQGRVPFHIGQGLVQGQSSGSESVTLTIPQMPAHTHFVNSATGSVNQPYPGGNLWGSGGTQPGYASAPTGVMSPGSVTNTGGSQAHENRAPYLVLTTSIALVGVFPSRN